MRTLQPLASKCNAPIERRVNLNCDFGQQSGANRHSGVERQPMTQLLFALSLGFGGLILAMQAGHAAPAQCGPRTSVIAALERDYGETLDAEGLSSDQVMVEVFSNDVTGTWTITATLPQGQTCLVASGQAFHMVRNVQPTGDPV
jgi:hypothetical protein